MFPWCCQVVTWWWPPGEKSQAVEHVMAAWLWLAIVWWWSIFNSRVLKKSLFRQGKNLSGKRSACSLCASAQRRTRHSHAGGRDAEAQLSHPPSARWLNLSHSFRALVLLELLRSVRTWIPAMEFSTLLPDYFYSVSVTPFNVTRSEDLLSIPGNETNKDRRLVIHVCITALYSLVCVVGLVGNVLVMYGVVR